MLSIDDLAANKNFTVAGQSGETDGDVPARTAPGRAQVHGHLGRRPHRGAARHLRGPGPGRPGRPGPPDRGEGRRHRDVALRRGGAAQRRLQRRGRPAGVGVGHGADPFRRDAPGSLGHPPAGRRHGPERRLRLASTSRRSSPALPASVSSRSPRTPTWPWPASGPGTTGTSTPGPAPTRTASSPASCPGCSTPSVGAEMIRRERRAGFQGGDVQRGSVEAGPARRSTPGTGSPLVRACAETETVINLHIGSSGASPTTTPDAPPDVVGVLFFAYAMFAAVDWLFTGLPVALPGPQDLHVRRWHRLGGRPCWTGSTTWGRYSAMYGNWKGDLTPAEVLQRNFWFCAVEDPSAFVQRDRIGVDHILVESDYPHCDSTWPNTQTRHRRGDRRSAGRGHRQDDLEERLRALPPPGARGRPARPQRVLVEGGRVPQRSEPRRM